VKIRIWVGAMLLSLMLLGQFGCTRHGLHVFRAVATVAVYAAILATHDSHYHNHHCGHTYVVHDNRPVYHYQGRWEYYEPDTGNWYHYDRRPGH